MRNNLRDFNINVYGNKYFVHENKTIWMKFTSADAKKYHQFCTIHGLTCRTSTLIDHILANFPSRFLKKESLT